MHLHRSYFCLFALITLFIAAPSAALGQVDISNWPQVRIDAVAIGKSGQPSLDLKNAALDVEEDGHHVAVQSVDPVTRPQSICVVVDTSASNRVSLPRVKSSVSRLLQQLPPQDEVCLAAFNVEATLLQPLSLRRDQLPALVTGMHIGGGTALYDSLSVISDSMVKDAHNPDRAIIVFTDGDDNYSRTTESDLVGHLERNRGPIVYMIRTLATNNHLQDTIPSYVRTLGGLALFPDSLSALDASVEQVLTVLKSRYSISYVSPESKKNGHIRRVKVRVRGANNSVLHAPEGYFAPSE